jgi:hypothetical protein
MSELMHVKCVLVLTSVVNKKQNKKTSHHYGGLVDFAAVLQA